MKYLSALIALLFAGMAQAEAPKVVTDIAPVHSIIARVMQGAGAPEMIVPAGSDPHDFAFRPSNARALSEADVVFWIGAELTPWLVDPLANLAAEADQISLTEGKIGEEHAWLDPASAQEWAGLAAKHLGNLDPKNRELYAQNAQAFVAEMNILSDKIRELVAPVMGKKFIVYHDAYASFSARFTIAPVDMVSGSDAQKPGVAQIAKLRELVTTDDIICAFHETPEPPRILLTITQGTAIKHAQLDPIGAGLETGTRLYSKLLLNIGQSLADCLGE